MLLGIVVWGTEKVQLYDLSRAETISTGRNVVVAVLISWRNRLSQSFSRHTQQRFEQHNLSWSRVQMNWTPEMHYGSGIDYQLLRGVLKLVRPSL